MGFLQRVVNGGGYVEREYGIGRGRIDLLIRWPYTAPDGRRRWQREAVELKVPRAGEADPLRRGLDHGILVIFDTRPETPPIAERTVTTTVTSPAGRAVTLLRG